MPVYLDHAASTPVRPEAMAAYVAALAEVGNPSSIHAHGQRARGVLEDARARVAQALGADPMQLTFTSGGTESINLALKGLYWSRVAAGAGRRILATRAEHHATVDALTWLEQHEGASVDWVPVDEHGIVDLAALRGAMGDDVALVTTLLANTEVGSVQPVAEIIGIAGDVPVHVDAVGVWPHVPVPAGAAAVSVSAHKLGGPVGVGALVLRRDVTVTPLVHGGSQQAVRSGTLDVAGAAAFAAASELHHDDVRALRDRLVAGVRAAVPDAQLRGHPTARLPGNAHFTFPGCSGDTLLFVLDAAGVSVSTGSACQAGVPEPSHVLLAMGLTPKDTGSALRFTLGHGSTDADVDALLTALPDAVAAARRAAAVA